MILVITLAIIGIVIIISIVNSKSLPDPIHAIITKRNKLANEYYWLNYPDMTWEQAVEEADFWVDYLNSDFHHKK